MCGLVAYIAKHKYSGFTTSQQKVFDQLLFADMLRGNDATGVVAVMKDGDFSIMKEASDSYGFAYSYKNSEVDKAVYMKGVALIGHNRAKTIGENKDENAHPFVEDKTFAMVHNGTLRNHKSMHNTEVDSHALTILFKQAMDTEDWKPALEKALGKVDGAFACIWYDQKRNEICFIRNSERPLSMITTPTGFVFCSEAPMGIWICSRNNEKIDKVESLDTMTLYQFNMKDTGGEFSKTFLSPKYPQKKKGFVNGTVTVVTPPTGTTKLGVTDNLDPVGKEDVRTPLSKNAFKKVRASLIGRSLSFWMEDYVDMVNNNSGECTTALIIGESVDGAFDLCEVRHVIRAVAGMKELGLRESDFYGNIKLRGRAYEVEFDKDLCQAIVRIDQLQVEEICDAKVVH